MRTIAGAGLGIALLVAEICFGRGELTRAFDALRLADPRWVGGEVFCTLVSMQCFARAQRCMLRAVAGEDSLARLPLRRVVRVTYSANALSTTMPAGSPLSVVYLLRQFRTWGLSYAAAGFALVASGVVSTATFAALLARVSSTAAEALETASAELAAIRPRQRDWAGAAGFALGNWLMDLVSLLAACQAIPGAHRVAVVAVVSAYLAGMSASSVAVLPGGFGVVEIAMIATLHAGGLPTVTATAAVLLYRLVSCLFVVAVGWIAIAVASAARLRVLPAGAEAVSPVAQPLAR